MLGDDPGAVGGVQCYIGRTENFRQRFHDHQRKKEFRDRVVLITNQGPSLTECHCGYLESRLAEMAATAKCSKLMNGNVPQPKKLPEAQLSDM